MNCQTTYLGILKPLSYQFQKKRAWKGLAESEGVRDENMKGGVWHSGVGESMKSKLLHCSKFQNSVVSR